MKLLIVGGVAGGASAAARARRLSEEADIVLFERGLDVSYANCGLRNSDDRIAIKGYGSKNVFVRFLELVEKGSASVAQRITRQTLS